MLTPHRAAGVVLARCVAAPPRNGCWVRCSASPRSRRWWSCWTDPEPAMEETMQKDQEKFRFLTDGFPRNQDNLQGWNRVMEDKADVKLVLFFDCSNQAGQLCSQMSVDVATAAYSLSLVGIY
ncbi:UMP-CMP kinase-like [Arapaima gigas]